MLSTNQDSMVLKSKNLEKELKVKTDEIQRFKHELEIMKKRYDEKDKFETEVLSNHQNNLGT